MSKKSVKILLALAFALAIAYGLSCGGDNDESLAPTANASLSGSWEAEDVQILSAATVNPGIWKPALVLWGKVSANTIGVFNITFQTNGDWIASGALTNSTIKSMVKDNQPGTNYFAGGTYTRSNDTLKISMTSYSGRGPTIAVATCTHSIDGNKMTVMVYLNNNETWKLTLTKQ